jgi:hypothetical protein
MKPKRIVFVVMAVLALLGAPGASHAVLNAVDPGPYTTAFGNFPVWYQDTHGKALELCLSKTVSPDPAAAGGFLCVLLPGAAFDPDLPIVFTTNFPDESFWFAADGAVAGLGVDLRYVAAVEAAFASGEVVNGDQVSFARVRFFADVPVPGTYTVTHPYGVEVFEVPAVGAGREIQFTRDVGIGGLGDFTGALKGDIGPFLVRAAGTITVGTETFIGDPNVLQTVTGSPFGTNFLRVQGPGGIDVSTNQFTVAGKLFTAATLPTPLVVDRSTYGRNATQTQIDVFALSPPTAAVSFDDSGIPVVTTPMNGDAAGKFYGQALVPPAALGNVTVTAANLGNDPVSVPANVTDVVSITKVEYSAGSLTIEASSSDETGATLTAVGYETVSPIVTGGTSTWTVTGLSIPPARITVTSSAVGSDTEEVVVLP